MTGGGPNNITYEWLPPTATTTNASPLHMSNRIWERGMRWIGIYCDSLASSSIQMSTKESTDLWAFRDSRINFITLTESTGFEEWKVSCTRVAITFDECFSHHIPRIEGEQRSSAEQTHVGCFRLVLKWVRYLLMFRGIAWGWYKSRGWGRLAWYIPCDVVPSR